MLNKRLPAGVSCNTDNLGITCSSLFVVAYSTCFCSGMLFTFSGSILIPGLIDFGSENINILRVFANFSVEKSNDSPKVPPCVFLPKSVKFSQVKSVFVL